MKKFLPYVFFVLLFVFGSLTAGAQCTPDPGVTDPEGNGEMVPDTIEGWEGTPMNLTLSIICPATADIGAGTISLHHITIKSITNKPAWLSYTCNPANCEYAAGALQCAQVTGTPPAGSAGYITMDVVVDVYMSLMGSPILAATDYSNGMPLVLLVHPAAGVDEINHSGFGSIAPQPNPFNGKVRIGCYSTDRRNASLRILDMVGNVIYTEHMLTSQGQNFFSFTGENLSQGIYFYSISDDRGNTVTRKMVKSE